MYSNQILQNLIGNIDSLISIKNAYESINKEKGSNAADLALRDNFTKLTNDIYSSLNDIENKSISQSEILKDYRVLKTKFETAVTLMSIEMMVFSLIEIAYFVAKTYSPSTDLADQAVLQKFKFPYIATIEAKYEEFKVFLTK